MSTEDLKRIAYRSIPQGYATVKEGTPKPDDLIWSWSSKMKNRNELIAAIAEIDRQQDELEAERERLARQFRSIDENGVGVRVSYDYDHGWIVECLNDGEWEVEDTDDTFAEAVETGEALAKGRDVKLHADPHLPPRRFRMVTS